MMLKREITYKDLDNNDVTETFYFNLSKAELAEMALRHGGAESLQALLRKMAEAQDGNAIVDNFKMIVLAAVGRRSDDGRKLIKTQQVKEDFEFSDAYNVLFMELLTDTAKCIAFIKAIVPTDLTEQSTTPQVQSVSLPATDTVAPSLSTEEQALKKLDEYTQHELLRLSQAEFEELRRRSLES